MKRNKILAVAAMLASSVANAASLEDARGDVRINQGKGFTPVQGSVELAPGDRVKVGRKSGARLVYPDGCSENVSANSLATVARRSPCSYVTADPPMYNEPPPAPICTSANPFDPACGDLWPAVGGIAIVGAGAGAAIAAEGSHYSQAAFAVPMPASP